MVFKDLLAYRMLWMMQCIDVGAILFDNLDAVVVLITRMMLIHYVTMEHVRR